MMPAMSGVALLDRLRRVRAVAVACLFALIVLGLAWELWLAPTGHGSWAIKVMPLTLALAGLLKQRMYTYRWTALVVWLYVTESLVRVTGEGGTVRALSLLQLVLALVLFAACSLHVRLRLGAAQADAAATL
jgi:uncharacterized membrane protein